MGDDKKAHYHSQGCPYIILLNTCSNGLKPMQELVKNLPRFGIMSGINKSYEGAKIRVDSRIKDKKYPCIRVSEDTGERRRGAVSLALGGSRFLWRAKLSDRGHGTFYIFVDPGGHLIFSLREDLSCLANGI